jgi:valyl-tRNA synthetase
VQPGHSVRARIATPSPEARAVLSEDGSTVSRLAKLSALELGAESEDAQGAAHAVLPDGTAVSVPLGDLVDLERECARLGTEMDRLSGAIRAQESKLGNEQFTAKAPAQVVEREREKLAAWREQAGALAEKRRRLGCPV